MLEQPLRNLGFNIFLQIITGNHQVSYTIANDLSLYLKGIIYQEEYFSKVCSLVKQELDYLKRKDCTVPSSEKISIFLGLLKILIFIIKTVNENSEMNNLITKK
jgi:hypothetical protein